MLVIQMRNLTKETSQSMNAAGHVSKGRKVSERDDLSRLRARALAERLNAPPRRTAPNLGVWLSWGHCRTPRGSPPQ
jgi:hypothetical protein